MTGVELPKLGFGTAAIALGEQDDAVAAIDVALDAGIRYFDTAPLYGGGRAEVRLGEALTNAPADVVVSTKCGRTRRFGAPAPPDSGEADIFDFSEQAIRSSIARSCDRLRRERLDIVFLHDIESAPDQAFAEALPVLRELQSIGRIGAVGAGCNTVDGLLAALNTDAGEVLLVAGRWTLLDRSAGTALLPAANKRGTGVVAGGILNSGCLANPDASGARFDYRPVSEGVRGPLRDLAGVAQHHDVSLVAAALQFPGRDPRIATTLLGASSARQLRGTLAALADPVPPEFWIEVQNMGLTR